MKKRTQIVLSLALMALGNPLGSAPAERPNIVIILTDDAGYGDFGVTGNTVIETPHIDAMAARSVSWENFYVSSVCTPTRASLMTGRYHHRTHAVDTWLGRAMMATEEVTVAEILREAGYATGIFGKWHLGDNYPMRPVDQGFEEALVHRGSGLGFHSDPIDQDRTYTDPFRNTNNSYTDPVLLHNGHEVKTLGYCTDVYFDRALQWMQEKQSEGRPFLAYIPTNAPHAPFNDVPEDLRQHYLRKDLASLIRGKVNDVAQEVDTLSRVAAMITNIDANVGRLFATLHENGMFENTLVLFLTDNGPNSRRFVGPFRGTKSEILEGGIRTPLWCHWPARLPAGRTVAKAVGAHIDLLPTLLEAAGTPLPLGLKIDGRSLWSQLTDPDKPLPVRPLVIQSHRWDQPQRYHNFMIREGTWKLVHASGFGKHAFEGPPAFKLYDLGRDPGEQNDLAKKFPGEVARLQSVYDRWYDDVMAGLLANPPPPYIVIDSSRENPVVLTWQDRIANRWTMGSVGFWKLNFAASGRFDVQVDMPRDYNPRGDWKLMLTIGEQTHEQTVSTTTTSALFPTIDIPEGPTELRADMILPDGTSEGGYQVRISRR